MIRVAPGAVIAVLLLPGSASALSGVGKVGVHPRSDKAAARLVHRKAETRADNRAANRRVPTRAELTSFRSQSDMPYAKWVTGHHTGTTDEIIQWAAAKWHLPADLLRAVAVKESYWRMSTVGDGGDSFGLFQMRRPFHCCYPLSARDAAFNADYYGGIIRAYYDGTQTWLNTVDGNGQPYAAGDIWGSVGAWFSGRWHDGGAEQYVAAVQQIMRDRTWATPGFRSAG